MASPATAPPALPAACPAGLLPGLPRWWPAAAAVCLAGIGGVLLWGLAVRAQTTGLAFDVWLNGLHSPLLDAAGLGVAMLFGPACAVALGVVFALLVAWRRGSVALGLGAGLAVGLSWASSAVVKLLVDRPRPDWHAIAHHVGAAEVDPSFPSGHVAFVASLTVVLGLLARRSRHRWRVWTCGALLTALVALARLYVGVHYPSDVIAAALYGLFGGVLASIAVALLLTRTALAARLDQAAARLLPRRRAV